MMWEAFSYFVSNIRGKIRKREKRSAGGGLRGEGGELETGMVWNGCSA